MPRGKSKATFICQQCGNDSPKWQGRCPYCGQWNTYVEVQMDRAPSRGGAWLDALAADAQELSQVRLEDLPRLPLSLNEVNRVLGGGLVPGSLTLIAGDPGIGKSTLLLQLAGAVAGDRGKVLYVSGEESGPQVKMRSDRLGISGRDLYFLAASEIGQVLDCLEDHRPTLAVVDSIQAVYDASIASGAGTVVQIRECGRRLMQWAKSRNLPVMLTGHVTKSGDVAGPRVLEHMVDVVLYMEGEPISSLRLLRSVKNRFGSTNEVGVFEMQGQGLVEVQDPSRAFLSEHREGAVGSSVIPTLEGSRPLLLEVQALTSPSALPTPRRVANGIDFNRLLLVSAVLTQRAGVSLSNQDIVVNVTGGMRVGEPAADLGTALAIASSVRNTPLEPWTAAIGEIGLSGEVRQVPQLERRINEVARLGLKRCLVPAQREGSPTPKSGLDIIPVATLTQAIHLVLPRGRRGGQTIGRAEHEPAVTGPDAVSPPLSEHEMDMEV